MLIAMDVGNSNVTIGVFEGERIRAQWRVSTNPHRTPDEYGAMFMKLLPHQDLTFGQINHAAIASVVPPLTATFQEVCQQYFNVNPVVVGPGIKTGLRIMVDNPSAVGADRVVDALAAHRLYGGPAIVVDLGTATTFEAVSREGDFLGGAIAPGIIIASEALFEKTARLSRVELVRPKQVIGKNSIAAVQSGLVFGYVGLVEGILARMKRELGGSATVIGTGGLAKMVAKETPAIDIVDSDLTLKGLRLIHQLNVAACVAR